MRACEMGRWERRFAFALIVLALLAFFLLNLLTPVMRDDWSYSMNFVTKERIRSFRDIFQSLGIHYVKVNGRLPVHFLAHLFLWAGKGAFNAVNTLAFAGLVTLVYFHAYGTLKDFRPYSWLAVWLGLRVLTPAFGESFLWVTGAANYLYGMLLILLFLIPFRRLQDRERPAGGGVYALPALLGGVLAGWTNENTGGALGLILLCLLLWRLLERKPVPLWCWAGLAGVAAGLALMVLAPGELTRLGGAGGMGSASDVLARAGGISLGLLRFLWPGLLVWGLLLAVFLRRKRDKKLLIYPLIFLLAAVAAAYAMAFSPQMPERVWSGPVILFLISALSLYRASGEPRLEIAGARCALASAVAVCALLSCALPAPKLAATKAAFDAREADAAAQLAAGSPDLILDTVYGSGTRIDAAEAVGDISRDPAQWLNVALARYVGANSVTAR